MEHTSFHLYATFPTLPFSFQLQKCSCQATKAIVSHHNQMYAHLVPYDLVGKRAHHHMLIIVWYIFTMLLYKPAGLIIASLFVLGVFPVLLVGKGSLTVATAERAAPPLLLVAPTANIHWLQDRLAAGRSRQLDSKARITG